MGGSRIGRQNQTVVKSLVTPGIVHNLGVDATDIVPQHSSIRNFQDLHVPIGSSSATQSHERNTGTLASSRAAVA